MIKYRNSSLGSDFYSIELNTLYYNNVGSKNKIISCQSFESFIKAIHSGHYRRVISVSLNEKEEN